LLSLLAQPQSWSKVRYWLWDLARELSAAEKDGTLPQMVALDRVWITAEGRAKLLDFPAPGTDTNLGTSAVSATEGPTVPAVQRSLMHVAPPALPRRLLGSQVTALGPAASRLPVDAHAVMNRIPTAASAEDLLDELQRLTKRTPLVTRLRRVGMLSAAALLQ